MKLGRLFSVAALAAASLLLIGAESRAEFAPLPDAGISLSTLQGTGFTVGDKSFDFTAPGSVVASGTVVPSQITVVPETVPPSPPVVPFGFQLTGGPIAATTGNSGDLTLTYLVTSSNGPITSVNLFANGAVSGNGSALVKENILDPTTQAQIGSGSITDGTITIPLSNETLTTIEVNKDISVFGGTLAGSSATFSLVENSFNQAIPEPASMAMMATGLLGVIGFGVARGRKLNQTV